MATFLRNGFQRVPGIKVNNKNVHRNQGYHKDGKW